MLGIPYASGILKALEAYGSGDNEIYDSVIRFYERVENIDEYSLEKLFEVLVHYPTSRSREIGFETLRLNKPVSAKCAAYFLLKVGVPKKEIVDLIRPFFNAADPEISEAALAIFGKYISTEYLPSATETLDFFIKTSHKRTFPNVALTLFDLAEKNGFYLLTDQLADLLYHELPAIKEGILIFIHRMDRCAEANLEFFRSASMIQHLWELTRDSSQSVAKSATQLLGKIGCEKKDASYIDHFLEIPNHNGKNSWIKLEVMQAINTILPQIAYPKQIEPLYLEVLNENNHFSREKETALQGLRYQSFKESLFTKYKDAPEKEIRKAAHAMFE